MNPSLNKRFWSEVQVVAEDGLFTVHLDSHPIKTPSKTAFRVPTERLAEMVAVEWDAQVEKVDPTTMPMTRRANAAIDKVAIQHTQVADMLAAYGGNDLLCYRANHPIELQNRQAAGWDPLLTWAGDKFSAPLNVTQGVMPVTQSKNSLQRLSNEVAKIAVFPLSGFHDLVTLSGSLVIGLAVIHDFLPIEKLWTLSRIDEQWQEELWGKDDVASAEADLKYQDFLDAYSFYQASL